MTPVVVFAFNRPTHLEKCLRALSRCENARQTSVVVYSDGPRGKEDTPGVALVREVLASIEWRDMFRDFDVVEQSENLGLARSIIGGVTAQFQRHEALIVLEDDLIVAPSFLVFMNSALEGFASDERVGAVTAYCPLQDIPSGYQADVMLVPRICSNSWGTWRDRWSTVDWTAKGAARVWTEASLRKRMNSAGADQLDRLRRQLTGRIRTWAILFQLWLVLEDKLCAYPVINLVENEGFDGSGTHTMPGDRINSEVDRSGRRLEVSYVAPDSAVIAAFHASYSGGLLGQVRRYFSNLKAPQEASADYARTKI